MTTEVKVPTVGESITSGVLANWCVNDGDVVAEGQHIFDLETDKITAEGLAESAGKISLKVEEGAEVEIGQVVAVIDASVTTPKQKPSAKKAASKAPNSEKKSAPIKASKTRTEVPKTKDDSAPEESIISEPKPTPVSKDARTTRKRMTPLRKRIAERLVAAQHETAHLTTFNEVDMSAIIDLRKKHQESFVAKYQVKLGFMSFFVKATVRALKEVPQINTQIDGDTIIQNHYYDIGIAVGSEKGLVVPVIRDCDSTNFAGIEKQILDYAEKIRAGKITLQDLEGGVFTITNGGIYGSLLSTPILNPPQSAILGMHTIKERPIALDGQIVLRPMMNLALSYDHRVIDGKEAVTFLVKIKNFLEDPTLLLFAS